MSLNAFQLKIVAAVLMLVDHIGYLLLPELRILRLVGRLSFPLFAYLLANGARHSRHRGRYVLRLSVCGLAFQPLFALCMDTRKLNIMITLLLGLLAICAYDEMRKRLDGGWGMIAGLSSMALLCLLGQLVNTDYGCYGVAMICSAYLFFEEKIPLACCWLALSSLSFIPALHLGERQVWALLALPLLWCYDGRQGRSWRWFFYGFYCLHIPLLYLLKNLL